MKKIKIAQIGTSTNSHGNDIFNNLKRNSDLFEIVGYTLPENEREKFPERMADFEGYREMTVDDILNDPEIEAVTVETEEIYTTKYATLAALAGKHIHMEKPGGTSFSDFEKMIEIVKKGDKVFHIGYMYRYNPYIMQIAEEIKNGDFGEIINIEAQMNCIHPEKVRTWLSNFPGGIMFFLGCHLVDLIYRFQGTPKKIIPMNKKTGLDGATGTDFGLALFEYDKGVSFAKVSAVETGGYARRQFVVSGTKKTVELKPFEKMVEGGYPTLITGKTEYKEFNWRNEGESSVAEPFNRYDEMMRSFAAYVRGEKVNPYTADSELELYKFLLEACGE